MQISDFPAVASAMHRLFEQMAGDLMAAVEACDGKAEMKQAEVIECVLDADRLEMYGDVDATELKKFRALSLKQQTAFGKLVFPYKTYQ